MNATPQECRDADFTDRSLIGQRKQPLDPDPRGVLSAGTPPDVFN